jgi:hypothetical protein
MKQIPNPNIKKSYDRHDTELRTQRLKIAIPLAILFIMMFGLLDLVIYPKEAKLLIASRIISDISLTSLLLILYKKKSYNVKFISNLVINIYSDRCFNFSNRRLVVTLLCRS